MSNLLEKASIITTPTAYSDGKLHSVKGGENADFDFQRGSAATRVNSQGIIENVQTLSGNLVQNGDFSEISSELVTNGDFATDSDWTKQTSWSISGGSANYDFLSDSKYIRQTLLNGGFVAGKTYKINFEITSGTAYMNVNSNASGLISINTYSVGSYSIYVTPSISASDLLFYGRNTSGTAFSIDNISVKELDPNDEWNTDSSCTIEIGEADFLSSTSNAPLYQSSTYFTIGKTYKITYTVSNYSSGRINWNDFGAGAGNGVNRIANGTYTEYYLKVGTSTNFGFQTNFGFTGSITDISVIEITDDTDLPRIDYRGGCGSLLLEPQSQNLIQYSEDFSQGIYFSITSVSVSSSTITDPTGNQNSFKLIPDNGTGGNRSIGKSFLDLTGLHTFACFAKKAEYNYLMLRTRNGPNTAVMFNLDNGTYNVNATSAGFVSAKIDDYGNGWYRCSMTLDPSQMTNVGQLFVSLSVGVTGNETNSFSGDGVSGVYIFGMQFEEQSYPTSYIPTSGSPQTRGVDSALDAGSSDLISSTEGVLYLEAKTNNSTTGSISINDSSATNRITARFRVDINKIQLTVVGSTNDFSFNSSLLTLSDYNKIAIVYNSSGEYYFFVNGVKSNVQSQGTFTADTLTQLDFNRGGGNEPFYGNVKCVAVFKEALTDAELAALTTI